MSARTSSSNHSFIAIFVVWVVVTGIAVAIGQIGSLLLSWTVGEAIERSLGTVAMIPFVGLFLGGGIGGLATAGQMFFLRGRVDGRRWIGGAIVGAALAMMAGMALVAPAMETQPGWIGGLAAGSTLGLGASAGQWVALRGRVVGLERWTFASFWAYALSVYLLFSLGGEGREFIALLGSGLSFGLSSGLGALWAGLLGQA